MASRHDCHRSAATCAMESIRVNLSIDRLFPVLDTQRSGSLRVRSLQDPKLQVSEILKIRKTSFLEEEKVARRHIGTWRFAGITYGSLSFSLARIHVRVSREHSSPRSPLHMENRRRFSSPRARSIRLSAIQRRADTADTTRDYGRLRDPLDLLFLDDWQAALVHQRAGPSGEREDPIVQLLLVLHEEGQGDRRVEALLPHQEALVAVTFDRRVPQIQYAEWSADLFLRIDDGEVFHTSAIDFHLNTLPMTVRSDQGHVAAHVLGVPARVHVRVLQTGLVELQEVGMHRYVGRHPAPLFSLLRSLTPSLARLDDELCR